MVGEIFLGKKFEEKKRKILEGGFGNFHVLADFDRTLTLPTVQSAIAILRDGSYLTPDYAEKAHALFNKYHPIELDSSVSESEKKAKMKEWWEMHFKLLIQSGLSKSDLKRIISEDKIQLREGVGNFLDLLHKRNVPLVIISSSGVGDVIPMYLKRIDKLYEDIHILTNLFEWEGDKAVGWKKPIIHSFSKDESSLKSFPEYNSIRSRKNVLLLGDSLGDLGMAKGLNQSIVLSIGFLNEDIEKNRGAYRKGFDVVLEGDQDFSFVNGLVREVLKK